MKYKKIIKIHNFILTQGINKIITPITILDFEIPVEINSYNLITNHHQEYITTQYTVVFVSNNSYVKQVLYKLY